MSKDHALMRFMFVLVLVVGCSTKPNPKSCLDNHCSDPDLPFCDVDGAIGGEPNTCIAVDCSPNQFEECRGDRALTCNASGTSYDVIECEFGCGASGCNACTSLECQKHLVPRYAPSACNAISTSTLTVSANMALDTSVDAACTNIITQPTGPEICLLHYSTIAIERNQTVTVTGTRVLALVADNLLLVDGILDVSGALATSGPGGGFVTSGGTTGAGGGAGYRHAGGSAGNSTTPGGAGNGGAIRPSPTTVTELFGGARTKYSNGGGAVTLISCRGEVSVPGLIDAGGGGGAGGTGQPGNYTPATGGGAGGTIVLQGLNVSVTGELYANGGGGGGGGFDIGNDGGKATRSTLAAAGGIGTMGGYGGTVNAPAVGDASGTPGAGGGSAGYIVVYTPDGVLPMLTPVGVSPAIEPKQTGSTN